MKLSFVSDPARDFKVQTGDRVMEFRRDHRRGDAANEVGDDIADHWRRPDSLAGTTELIAALMALVRQRLQFDRRLAFVTRHVAQADETRHGVEESSHA